MIFVHTIETNAYRDDYERLRRDLPFSEGIVEIVVPEEGKEERCRVIVNGNGADLRFIAACLAKTGWLD